MNFITKEKHITWDHKWEKRDRWYQKINKQKTVYLTQVFVNKKRKEKKKEKNVFVQHLMLMNNYCSSSCVNVDDDNYSFVQIDDDNDDVERTGVGVCLIVHSVHM